MVRSAAETLFRWTIAIFEFIYGQDVNMARAIQQPLPY
jgi:hypothetical protein